ncbi:hypothetical protein CFP56_030948 [Quercus suber]|uniref:Uncharacterized protein n=1 Tax=Quercus suber TaxID=58331 RepID=A0AAW0JMC9_QUESU
MATLPRDFDDFSNQLEEGEIHDTLQQCGRMAYSCFNWTVTITMNLPLEKIHLFTKLLTVHPPIKSYLLSWPHLEARALCSRPVVDKFARISATNNSTNFLQSAAMESSTKA